MDLTAAPLLTSLTKNADDNTMSWLGGLAADFLNFNPDEEARKKESGNCAGFGEEFLKMIPCDKPAKFMCEAKKLKYVQICAIGNLN